MDIAADQKKEYAKPDGQRKKALHDYYETAVKPEGAQGLIRKLTADDVKYDGSLEAVLFSARRQTESDAGFLQ